MKKLGSFFFFVVIISMIFTTNVKGQTTYTSIASTDWNTPTTWNPNGTPTSIDDVIIANGFSVPITGTAGTCTNLTVQTGGALTTSVGLTVSGTFTLQAGATYTKNNSSVTDLPGITANAIDNASTVIHAAGGSITTAQVPAPANLVFGNFTDIAATGTTPSLPMIVNGNLVVTKTGTSTLRGANSSYPNQTHTVYGSATLNSGRIICVDGTNSTGTWNFEGPSVTVNGGTFYVFASSGATGGTGTYNIDGNLIINDPGAVGYGTNANNGGTAIINLKGNLINNFASGIKQNLGAAGGTFTINLIGGSAQQWTGAFPLAFTTVTCNININNTFGVALNNAAILNGLVTLTLTNGNVNTTNTNLLTVGAGAIGGGSSSSFINGPLRRNLSVDGTYAYPIGKGAYSPVSLTLSGAAYSTANLDVEAFNVKHPQNSSVTDYLNRYWTIAANGITLGSYNADFIYDNADIAGTEGSLMLGKYDGSVWSVVGGVNAPANTLSGSGLASFSDFTGGEGSALPVELSSFIASAGKNGVMLKWVTNSETNNFGWEIEMRNSSQASWSKVGFVNGAGNSNLPKEYSFTHKPGHSGKFSYRLKQLDNDGSVSYSNEVEVSVHAPQTFSLAQNYPNPFNPSTTIEYALPMDSKVTLAIYSLIGEKVADLIDQEQASGFYSYQLNTSNLQLTSGIYLYKLTAVSKSNEIFSKSMKMLLLK